VGQGLRLRDRKFGAGFGLVAAATMKSGNSRQVRSRHRRIHPEVRQMAERTLWSSSLTKGIYRIGGMIPSKDG
jgi:hypothetical protein